MGKGIHQELGRQCRQIIAHPTDLFDPTMSREVVAGSKGQCRNMVDLITRTPTSAASGSILCSGAESMVLKRWLAGMLVSSSVCSTVYIGKAAPTWSLYDLRVGRNISPGPAQVCNGFPCVPTACQSQSQDQDPSLWKPVAGYSPFSRLDVVLLLLYEVGLLFGEVDQSS